MKKHKYESLVKFVHLDGVKEFRETDPALFSENGISTCTLEVDNGKSATVTMHDAKRACEMFLDSELSLVQFQQWGEWLHMMDFFELIPDGEAPNNDESLIEVLTEIDNIELVEENKVDEKVKSILSNINVWIEKNR